MESGRCYDAATISYLGGNIFQRDVVLGLCKQPPLATWCTTFLARYIAALQPVMAFRWMKYPVKTWVGTHRSINGLPNGNRLLEVWLILIFVPRRFLLSTQNRTGLMPRLQYRATRFAATSGYMGTSLEYATKWQPGLPPCDPQFLSWITSEMVHLRSRDYKDNREIDDYTPYPSLINVNSSSFGVEYYFVILYIESEFMEICGVGRKKEIRWLPILPNSNRQVLG